MESQLINKLIINILILEIPFIYYSPKLMAASSIGSAAFITSSFGASYFPGSFMQFWMVLMEHVGLSLYYNYLSLDIVSLYLSILGSYVFLTNVVGLVHSRNEADVGGQNRQFYFSIVLVILSLLMSANPFFANAFGLGVGSIPFLMLSLASVSEALRFKFSDWRFLSLVFLTGFFLILSYEYILLPVYFVIIFIAILVPVSYKAVPMLRVFVALFLSFILFFVGSGISGFITASLSGSLGGLFPFFRPLNLEHEYALLSVSGLLKAVSGLSFNVGFWQSTLILLERFTILLLILLALIITVTYIFQGGKKPLIFYLLFFVTIILSLPYKNDIPLIGYVPIFLISHHIVTYNHLGEALSVFDANRLLLFLYWIILPSTFAVGVSTFSFLSQRDMAGSVGSIKNLVKRYKMVLNATTAIFSILVILVVIFSSMNGPYSYLNFDKSSPTYAYASGENDSYNRMLLYQNQNLFYPGNIYPSYMQMQADIPDKPMYVNFLNMESSPLVIPTLNSLPPASFIFQNNTERFIHGTRLTDNFNEISNANENVTAGYPAFVLGTQYTFDQYIFNNYFTRTNETSFKSYNDTYNYGEFVYYSIPNEIFSYLNTPGGMIQINTDIKITSPIQNGTGYTFGISNASQYYSLGVNELNFSIGVFNRSTVPALLGYGNLITNGFNHSEYLSVGNGIDPTPRPKALAKNGFADIRSERITKTMLK